MPMELKNRTATFLFMIAIFTGSFLLFSIQPLLAKAILPQLGGAPSVWNVCMMTYQILLLAGYFYAYTAQRWKRFQPFVQGVFLLAALISLPIGIKSIDFSTSSPSAGLVLALLCGAGLPFFLLSAMSPLLQVWFSRLKPNPYFLYSISNLGSLTALVSYPFLIEPFFSVVKQKNLWSVLFVLYAVLLCACYVSSRKTAEEKEAQASSSGERPPLKRLAYWVLLAFVPSSLMLGVTTHISMDVSPTPLFWIAPLAIYLMTYILAFSRFNKNILSVVLSLQSMAVILFLSLYVLSFVSDRLVIVHLVIFFIMAQVCHSTLAENKPAASQLTLFYLMVAVGGALGGIFNGLLAPVIFNDYYEYIVVFILALLLRPGKIISGRSMQEIWRDFAYPLAVFFLAFGLYAMAYKAGTFNKTYEEVAVFLLIGGLLPPIKNYPVRYAMMAIVLVFFGSYVFAPKNIHSVFRSKIFQERNFFGVVRVVENKGISGKDILLYNGTIIHGMQFQQRELRNIPRLYYSTVTGLASTFKIFENQSADWRVGVVGLGIGATAFYAKPTQNWVFFEIDETVAKLSEGLFPVFTFLETFTPDAEIVIGDGRVSLSKETKPFNLITLDAFSSDAIPTHLLTKEAVETYMQHLTPEGILLVHITNKYLSLNGVLSAIADDLGLYGAEYVSMYTLENIPVSWVAISRSKETINTLKAGDEAWTDLPSASKKFLWTDDYANILSAFKKKGYTHRRLKVIQHEGAK